MVFSLIDAAADEFAEMLKFPADQIKLVVCLLISYPVGFIFKRINSVPVRHFLSITLGLFYQYLIYKNDVIHPIILWVFTYLVLKFTGRKNAMVVFVVAMLYLSALHFRGMIRDWGGYNIDVTGSMMLSVCKVTSIAWNYKDGGVDINKLSAEQRKKRVVHLPSFIEYFSFVSYFGSGLVGPSCDYKDFEEFIHKRGDYQGYYATFLYSFGYLISGLVSMALLTLLVPTYNSAGYLTDHYAERSWVGKYIYLTITMFIHRCKYYTAWLIATANVTSSGLNYNPNGKTQAEKYSKIVAVKPIDGERCDNIRDKLEAWNTASQLWLKNYVYFRVCSEEEARVKPAKATFASNVVFMVSAFWHGFYPGYYLAFLFMFFAQQIAKSLFKIRHKLRWIPEPIGWVLRCFLTKLCVDIFGSIFALLELNKSLTFLRAWHYAPFVIVVVLFVLFNFTGLGKGPKKAKTPANATTEKATPVANGEETKKEQ